MLFKLIHGLVEVSSITLTPLTSCTCGHSRRYETHLHSFLPLAVKLWNDLPQSLMMLMILCKNLNSTYIPRTPCMIICL